jgi:type III restriction enzyme
VLDRRSAGYWYKSDRTGSAIVQQDLLFAEEMHDDLPLVNRLRDDLRRWRDSGYRVASNLSRELLAHWAREDRPQRLFFCQREAVEALIYLAELRLPRKQAGRSPMRPEPLPPTPAMTPLPCLRQVRRDPISYG